MSTNQHIVPRFLQRGFTIPGTERAWWITKTECVERNIEKLWRKRGFYSVEGIPPADQAITHLEQTELQGTVERIRDHRLPTGDAIGTLVSHLEVRTERLREEGRRMLSQSEQKVFSRMRTPEEQIAWGRGYTPPNDSPELIGEKVREDALRKGIANNNTVPRVEGMARSIAATTLHFHEQIVDGNYTRDSKQVTQEEFLNNREEIARHLAREPSPREKAAQYADFFKWKVRRCRGLVLGDTMVFFWREGKQRYTGTLGDTQGLKGIYLPVAHDTVLVGKLRKRDPELHGAQIREGAVMTTGKGFICPEPPVDCRKLQERIGLMRHEMSIEDIDAIVEMTCDYLGIE